MTGNFYLDSNVAILEPLKHRRFGSATRTQKLNYLLTIDGVDISNIPWLGSGFIATEFRVTLNSAFSFLRPYQESANDTFGLAVRYPQTNLTGLNVTRRKIWNTDNRVFYPLYAGERINSSFALELWTRPDSDRILIDEPIKLILSLLSVPEDCCDTARPEIVSDEYCGIWDFQDPLGSGNYDLPLQFSMCIVNGDAETYFRVNELGEIRITEIPDFRVHG